VVADTESARQAGQQFTQSVGQAIAAKVATRRAGQGPVGILDEDAALGRLSDRSGFVLAAQWLVRLLLIAIDCLPVLTKMMGGVTRYDVERFDQADRAARADRQAKQREEIDALARRLYESGSMARPVGLGSGAPTNGSRPDAVRDGRDR
jgi:hypothetical protein